MAWIESHQALGHHPKTLAFASALSCSLPTAVGHLQYLWWWALDYAQDGVVRASSRSVVARACEWRGKPDKFWSALAEAGFVDELEAPVGTVRIHDWREYAGRLLEKRKKDADRKRAISNGRPMEPPLEVARNSAGHPPDVHGSSGVPYQPYQPDTNQPDQPDRTNPTPLPPSEPSEGGAAPPHVAQNGSSSSNGACCVLAEVTSGQQHSESCSVGRAG
jgi:hypothetical protein